MLSRSLLLGLLCIILPIGDVPAADAAGIDYIGLRIVLPLGNVPFMVGVDLGMRLPFGWGVASLFLTPEGKTLILGSVEVAFGGEEGRGTSLLRLTAGISYFDLTARFPSPLVGAGFSYRLPVAEVFQVGVGGEILFPLALAPPLLTLGGGWVLRAGSP